MITAELIHNPYLLNTSVKFNGQEPRINSQIEKYENTALTEWVQKVPQIFYDEMNGYDFDLYFTGTPHDYEEVVKAFEKAKISKEDVRIFYKNELENADIKSQEIDDLLKWLLENRNRKFEYDAFKAENSDLFDSTYPYIIVRGNEIENENEDSVISLEKIESIQEIKGTLLTNTPILFCIDNTNIKQFRVDLVEILNRKDIDKKQMFFKFATDINKDQLKRVIIDLGVENPQIVDDALAESVKTYMRNYPVTEYIRESIKLFRSNVDTINVILEKENEESYKINARIHEQINKIENNISKLKEIDEYFVEKDNFKIPAKFTEYIQNLQMQIGRWRNRKTKIIGEEEAKIAAHEYENDLNEYISKYIADMRMECHASCANIAHSFREKYVIQDVDKDYSPDILNFKEVEIPEIPSVLTQLLQLRDEKWEVPKTDIFNLFKKSSAEEKTPVLVITYYYEWWRNKVAEIMLPIARKYSEDCIAILNEYYNTMAENYHEHLVKLIQAQSEEKDKVAEYLSDDERKLQEDNDWLAEFESKLTKIERG